MIESNTNNVILGMKFLRENDTVIDLKQKRLAIDGREYKINIDEDEEICFADKSLIEKNTIFTVNNDEEIIETLFQSYKEKNP